MKHLSLKVVLFAVAVSLVLVAGCGGGSSDLTPLSTGSDMESAQRSGSVSSAGFGLYLGDMDGNGLPSAGDAIKILRMAVGLDSYEAPADCNGNGSADAGDAIKVLRCATGVDAWPMGTTGDALVGEWMGAGFEVVSGTSVATAQEDDDATKSCYISFAANGTYTYREALTKWQSGTWELAGDRLDMHVTDAMPAGSIGETHSATLEAAGDNFTATFEVDGGVQVCETFERLTTVFPGALGAEWLLTDDYSAGSATNLKIETSGAYRMVEPDEDTEAASLRRVSTMQQTGVRDLSWELGMLRASEGGHLLIMPSSTDDGDGVHDYSYTAWEFGSDINSLQITDPGTTVEVLHFARRLAFPSALASSYLRTMITKNGVQQLDGRDSENWYHMELTTDGEIYDLGLTSADRTKTNTLHYYANGLLADLVEEATLHVMVPGGVYEVSQNSESVFIAYNDEGVNTIETYSKPVSGPAGIIGLWNFSSVQALSVGTAQPAAGTQLLVRDNGTYRMSDGSGYWEEGNTFFFSNRHLLVKPQSASDPGDIGDGNWFQYTLTSNTLAIDEWHTTDPDKRLTFVRASS